MKQNRTFTFIMLLLIILGLSACSPQSKTIDGKYVSINDNEVVCTSEDGVVTTFISADGKVFCIEYVKE